MPVLQPECSRKSLNFSNSTAALSDAASRAASSPLFPFQELLRETADTSLCWCGTRSASAASAWGMWCPPPPKPRSGCNLLACVRTSASISTRASATRRAVFLTANSAYLLLHDYVLPRNHKLIAFFPVRRATEAISFSRMRSSASTSAVALLLCMEL